MSVKITNNTAAITAQTRVKSSIFLRLMLEDIDRRARPNTPRDGGDLRRDIQKQVLATHGVIRWLKNYAIYQEAKQHTNYTTPGTGPHFAENAVKAAVAQSGGIAKKAGLI